MPTDTVRISARDAQILAFEQQWWRYAGAKEAAILDRFNMTATRYYQVLNTIIDQPAALEHDPMLVRRLLRLRDARKAHRAATRGAFSR